MRSKGSRRTVVLLTLMPILMVPGIAFGERAYSISGRTDFYDRSVQFSARKAPDLVMMTGVSELFDPEVDSLVVGCFFRARKPNEVPVARTKARYSADFVVLDLTSGTFESRRIGSGKVKTESDGFASFSFPVPPAALPNRFLKDQLAIVHTVIEMTNAKKVIHLSSGCNTRVTR